MPEFEFVESLPEAPRRDVAKYVRAALADPSGRWIRLPWTSKEDSKGVIVGNIKRQHGGVCEARTVKGVIYCRRRPDKAPTK